MAEVNLIDDTHCHELAEEIAKLLPEKEAAVALPPALTALLTVVEVV
jgi:hypothetical protein